jgi:hypothetical protein
LFAASCCVIARGPGHWLPVGLGYRRLLLEGS